MFASVGGIDIFYTETGRGIPCLVPSLASTPIYERTFNSPGLLAHFRLIFTELRANRTAADDAETVTLDRLVADLDGLRQALGHERVALLGHSGHSVLALAYAARYPERTERVIVVGGMPTFSAAISAQNATYWEVVATPERKRLLAAGTARVTPERLAALTPAGRMIASYAAGGARYFADPTYDSTPLWAGFEHASPAIIQRFWGPTAQFSTFDPQANFPHLAAPVFIAQGTLDFSVTPLAWSGVKDLLPDATYCAFERSGHYPQFEEPEVFDREIVAWLDRGASSSS